MASGGAQLVRGVRDEPALAVERPVQPFEHRVERVGKLLDLAVRAGERDPLVQAASGHPAGGFGDPVQKIDPARLALARQYSRCMRENGVPKFPDPDAYGGIALDPEKIGTDPIGAEMKAAEKACTKYRGDGGGQLSDQTGG
jgi:hypothetical protein